jgi:hypothetical protein
MKLFCELFFDNNFNELQFHFNNKPSMMIHLKKHLEKIKLGFIIFLNIEITNFKIEII